MDGNYTNGYNQEPNNGWSDNGSGQNVNNGYDNSYGNGYDNNTIYDANPNKNFSSAAPEHAHSDIQAAKTALSCGVLALLGSIFTIVMFFFMNRIYYALNICMPIVSIFGVVSAIKCLKNDRGIGQAYAGLIISILSILPAIISFLLFILNMVACFLPG